jgi:quercetin dioxygenase-like cupin family protein
MTRPAFIHAKDVVVEQLDPGITRQILGYGDGIMTCRISFETGAVGSVHSHPHSQTTYVESGRFRFQVDGAFQELGPGDCVYIAPDLIHGSTCIEAGTLIDNFSPMRADFLGEADAP